MNLTVSKSATRAWKRLQMQHVTAVAGLALTFTGALAMGGWSSSDGPHPASPRLTAPTPLSGSGLAQTPQDVYYLVSSQAEADRVTFAEEHAAWTRLISNVPEPMRTVHIIIVTNPAETVTALQVMAENARDKASVVYFDLTGH